MANCKEHCRFYEICPSIKAAGMFTENAEVCLSYGSKTIFEFDIDRLKDLLSQYFEIGDSDYYILTRDKSGFAVGTIGIDDFEEFNEEIIDDIATWLIAKGVGQK